MDELNRETWVRVMAARVSGSTPTVIGAEGDGVVPPTIIVDSFLVDGTIGEESKAWSEVSPTDIVEPMP